MLIPDASSKFVLASASPRRRELLALLGIEFDILIPEIDETPLPDESPCAFAERLAAEKAAAIQVDPGTVMVAADTVVVLNNTILNKPADAVQTHNMLTNISGQTHKVMTGVCILQNGRETRFSVSTDVIFRTLKHRKIEAYIATGEPMDKAGAYAIQGGAAHMVRSINGSYTNVVGLPLCELYERLISF